jgi:hypothetical protein
MSVPEAMGLALSAGQIGQLAFHIYDRMFESERMDRMRADPKKMLSITHYNRASFAYVLRSIKSWSQPLIPNGKLRCTTSMIA